MRFGKWKSDRGRLSRLLTVVAVIVLVLAIGSALTIVAGRFNLLKSDPARYPQGTYINGVDVSGCAKYKARELVSGRAEAMLSEYSCAILIENADPIVFNAEDIDLKTDIDSVLEAALQGGEHKLSYRFSEYALRRKLQSTASSVDTQPTAPYYVPVNDAAEAAGTGRFVLSPGESGRRLDVDACIAKIMSGETEFPAPFVEEPPDTSPEALPQMPRLMGEFSTSFAGGALSAPNRVANIKKAAELVNGSIVEAGQVFSCNDVLGDRTEALGWLPAPGITEGGAGTEDQPGGGVCQVSTTLYNAVLLADMAIVYRQGHSRMVSYAPAGSDATIDTGSIDFKWKNTSDASVYVFAWVDDSRTVYCQLYGTPVTDCRIELYQQLANTIPPTADEYIEDTSLQPWESVLENEAITGGDYDTYRLFFKDGREVSRELVAQTHYNMHPRRFRVGSAYYRAVMKYARQTGYQATPSAAPTNTAAAPANTPAVTPTNTPTADAYNTPSVTPTPTPQPTPTAEPMQTAEPSPTAETTPTAEPAPTAVPQPTPEPPPADDPTASRRWISCFALQKRRADALSS